MVSNPGKVLTVTNMSKVVAAGLGHGREDAFWSVPLMELERAAGASICGDEAAGHPGFSLRL